MNQVIDAIKRKRNLGRPALIAAPKAKAARASRSKAAVPSAAVGVTRKARKPRVAQDDARQRTPAVRDLFVKKFHKDRKFLGKSCKVSDAGLQIDLKQAWEDLLASPAEIAAFEVEIADIEAKKEQAELDAASEFAAPVDVSDAATAASSSTALACAHNNDDLSLAPSTLSEDLGAPAGRYPLSIQRLRARTQSTTNVALTDSFCKRHDRLVSSSKPIGRVHYPRTANPDLIADRVSNRKLAAAFVHDMTALVLPPRSDSSRLPYQKMLFKIDVCGDDGNVLESSYTLIGVGNHDAGSGIFVKARLALYSLYVCLPEDFPEIEGLVLGIRHEQIGRKSTTRLPFCSILSDGECVKYELSTFAAECVFAHDNENVGILKAQQFEYSELEGDKFIVIRQGVRHCFTSRLTLGVDGDEEMADPGGSGSAVKRARRAEDGVCYGGDIDAEDLEFLPTRCLEKYGNLVYSSGSADDDADKAAAEAANAAILDPIFREVVHSLGVHA